MTLSLRSRLPTFRNQHVVSKRRKPITQRHGVINYRNGNLICLHCDSPSLEKEKDSFWFSANAVAISFVRRSKREAGCYMLDMQHLRAGRRERTVGPWDNKCIVLISLVPVWRAYLLLWRLYWTRYKRVGFCVTLGRSMYFWIRFK